MNALHPRGRDGRTWLTPPMDLAERDGDWRATLDVPGVAIGDVHIEVTDGALTVLAPRADQPHLGWRRSLALSPEIDASGVAAALKDGVLTLTLPRAAAHRPRRVEVQVGG